MSDIFQVHFNMGDESNSESEDAGRLTPSSSVSELVKKSTAVLKTLTMMSLNSEADQTEEIDSSHQDQKANEDVVENDQEGEVKENVADESDIPVEMEENIAEDKVLIRESKSCPVFVLMCPNDPPDPEELKKLPKSKPKRKTMAAKWRQNKRKLRESNGFLNQNVDIANECHRISDKEAETVI